jgi:hypothetical protein
MIEIVVFLISAKANLFDLAMASKDGIENHSRHLEEVLVGLASM